MYNEALARDYLRRAENRLAALGVLMERESWADVVREAQEIVEIVLRALLRLHRIEVPRVHDVSPVLEQERGRLQTAVGDKLDELMRISRSLRRDRELAFYGSEDLTPTQFYTRQDAQTAYREAQFVYEFVHRVES